MSQPSPYAIEPAQRTAARIAGLLYLAQMAAGVFGFYAKGRVIDPDPAQTAANMAASERLFRLGIASDLLAVVTVIALVAALYVVLAPVNRSLARLAAFWRLAENSVAAAATLFGFVALRLLSGAESLRAIETAQLQALARLFIGIQGQGLQIAFVLLGLGSAVFSWLWFESRYVPRVIAVLGIFASLTLSLVTLAILIYPALGRTLGLTYMAPMGIYEVGLGLWLLARGLPSPSPTAPRR